MMQEAYSKDLVVLVADKNMEQAVRALLEQRTASLGISRVSYDVFVHPQRDPGCLRHSEAFLRPFCAQYRFSLVMFDREGCGDDWADREELQRRVQATLAGAGWDDRTAVVVLEPELESWVWSDSLHVADALNWRHQTASLTDWLADQGFLESRHTKPVRPKEAVEAVLAHTRTPRSSAIYGKLARTVGLERCSDPAFVHFRSILRAWFGGA
ncbi:MAG: hypothetical protein M3Z21_06405 [Pseudomonadota bacterium]|nr:hypothetical protein [Pseudomonadota bacterium]